MLVASFFMDRVTGGAAGTAGTGAGGATGLAAFGLDRVVAVAPPFFFEAATRPWLAAGFAARAFVARLPRTAPFAGAARRIFVFAL
jgi:hypothetical protein